MKTPVAASSSRVATTCCCSGRTLSMPCRKAGQACQKRPHAPAPTNVVVTCFHGCRVRLAGTCGKSATRQAAKNIHVASAGVPGRSRLPCSRALANADDNVDPVVVPCPNRKRRSAAVVSQRRSVSLASRRLYSKVQSMYHSPRTLRDNWPRDTHL